MNTAGQNETIYELPADYFAGEPIFVPRNDPSAANDEEDDGVVLVGGYRSSDKKGTCSRIHPVQKYAEILL